jgi:WhiB family redox-sensing transcriptional regulator
MSYEQVDFGHHDRFDNRILGSVGNTRHTITGPTPLGAAGRPQLSLVPDQSDRPDPYEVAPATIDDLWQDRALCAQTDPEAFFPEKGGSTREAKRICMGCEVRTECLEYALAHDERFGIWGGLSERERRRLKRGII